MKLTDEVVTESQELLLNNFSRVVSFDGVGRFLDLGGPALLVQMLPIAAEWSSSVAR